MYQSIPRPHAGQAGRGRSSSIPGTKPPDPYAAFPHRIGGNPDVSPLGKAILLALLGWARGKDHCWPSDASIGAKVGKSDATVQRGLKELQGLGLIRREKTTANRTGRLIRLAWRSLKDEGPAPSPMSDPPASHVRDEGDVIVKGDPRKDRGEALPQRQRPQRPPAVASGAVHPKADPPPAAPPGPTPTTVEPGPSPVVTAVAAAVPFPVALNPQQRARLGELSPKDRERVTAWLASEDRILLGEAARLLSPRPVARPVPATTVGLLSRIREDPRFPAMAAQVLAGEFDDQKSWTGLLRLCERAWRGEIAAETLLDAYRQARGPRAKNPGALFTKLVNTTAAGARAGRHGHPRAGEEI